MFLSLLVLFGDVIHSIAPPEPRLLIFGLGGVGRAVVDVASSDGYFGDRIQGTSRSPPSTERDDDNKIIPFTAESVGSAVPECTHILVTIPPPREEDVMFEAVVHQLEKKLPKGAWLGFVSTSGVFGNHDGAWVTEESPLYCSEESPTYRYITHEEKWHELSQRCGWTCRIFRCAGLYGPDRSALHTMWRKRTLNVSPSAGITNRIHEMDVARAIVASMKSSQASDDSFRVYNLSDDEPETRSVVMQYAAELLESIGVDISLQTETTDSSSSARSNRRGTEIKRVSNERMKQELVSELLYHTYREGITAIFQDPSSPWQKELEKSKHPS